MLVLDLFAGTGSSTAAFEAAGHKVVRVELDPQFPAELHADVMDLTVEKVLALCGGVPDFVWASPPCTAFSVASISTHWTGGDLEAHHIKSWTTCPDLRYETTNGLTLCLGCHRKTFANV